MNTAGLVVLDPGALSLIQDLGRTGFAAWGVSPSGAADRGSHDLANRLVGNTPDAATIELTGIGLTVLSRGTTVVALTGAAAALEHTPAHSTPRYKSARSTIVLADGDRLAVRSPLHGARSYLALRGGIAAPLTLGSRSRDTLSGLGPEPVLAGDVLPVGTSAAHWPAVTWIAPSLEPDFPRLLRFHWGPRHALFEPSSLDYFHAVSTVWTVTDAADRVGARLRSPRTLNRIEYSERSSEGIVTGAIQVPTEGNPLIFLADRPVTGGYPVLGVLTEESIDLASQLRPGDTLRFRAVSTR